MPGILVRSDETDVDRGLLQAQIHIAGKVEVVGSLFLQQLASSWTQIAADHENRLSPRALGPLERRDHLNRIEADLALESDSLRGSG